MDFVIAGGITGCVRWGYIDRTVGVRSIVQRHGVGGIVLCHCLSFDPEPFEFLVSGRDRSGTNHLHVSSSVLSVRVDCGGFEIGHFERFEYLLGVGHWCGRFVCAGGRLQTRSATCTCKKKSGKFYFFSFPRQHFIFANNIFFPDPTFFFLTIYSFS